MYICRIASAISGSVIQVIMLLLAFYAVVYGVNLLLFFLCRCAGICSYEGHGGLCSIGLSEPLLKFRPRKDLVETLLVSCTIMAQLIIFAMHSVLLLHIRLYDNFRCIDEYSIQRSESYGQADWCHAA